MLWLRQLLSLGVAAMLFCLAHGDAYPQAVSPWACADNESTCKSVSIVHNSWHAAIVLRTSDLAVRTMPELADFPCGAIYRIQLGRQRLFPRSAIGNLRRHQGGPVVHRQRHSPGRIHGHSRTFLPRRNHHRTALEPGRLSNAWSIISTQLSAANNHPAVRAPLLG